MSTVILAAFGSPIRPRSTSSPVMIDTRELRDTATATSAGASQARVTAPASPPVPGPVSVAPTSPAARRR